MTLTELKKQAAAIILIPSQVGDFSNISFTTSSGGAPCNNAGLTEIHRANNFRYRTTANGDAYSGEIVILCKDTGTKDKNGRSIHIDPHNRVFVYRYHSGSPSDFDYGVLEVPEL